jgi:hypothetical protein
MTFYIKTLLTDKIMKIIYRTSNNGYSKIKPDYVDNKKCLDNFIKNCNTPDLIIADKVSEEYYNELLNYNISIVRTNLGSGAQSFKYMLEEYILTNNISQDDNEIVYLVENDYLHKPNTKEIIEDCFNVLNPDYLTLYDHPDKYINATEGGNPFIESKGEVTRVLLSSYSHWKMTNSTTMTFASRIKTLKEDYNIISKYIQGTYPNDFKMFIDLRNNNRVLLSPLPGLSTHGETQYLSPLINWSDV